MDVKVNFSAFSFMVSGELGLANKVYHVNSMINTNFILCCNKMLSDGLEGVVINSLWGTPLEPHFSLASLSCPSHFSKAGITPGLKYLL